MPLPTKTLLACPDITQNKDTEQLFKAVQGYTIVSHGKDYVWLGLVRFSPAVHSNRQKSKDLRKILCSYGAEATKALDLYQTQHEYRNAKAKAKAQSQEDSLGADKLNEIKNRLGMVTAVGLSSAGFRLFPPTAKPGSKEFDDGLAKRFSNIPATRDGTGRYDAVIVLASNQDPERYPDLDQKSKDMDDRLKEFAVIHWERGYVNRKTQNGKSVLKDHFGFVEGTSQPALFDTDHDPNRWTSKWKPDVGLGCVLSQQPDARGTQEYGSFMAFLKIEQRVKEFEDAIEKSVNDPSLIPAAQATGLNMDNLARGRLLGRRPDGASLLPARSATNPGAPTDPNDFDFTSDPHFEVCPATAHIRKMNPRTEHHRHNRVLRRGVLYGPKPPEPGEKMKPGEKRGMLFQCFQSDLAVGFEQLFRGWAMNKDFPREGCGMDALLANDALPKFMEMKAGEYFYFPSIPFFEEWAGELNQS